MKETSVQTERILKMMSHCDYFESLPTESLARLADASRAMEFRKKERIFIEGRKGDAVFMLARGSVQLTKAGRSGASVVIRTVRPFEVFAEAVIFEADNYPVTATAVAPSLVVRIRRSDFIRLLDDSAFRIGYVRSMAARLRYLTERVRNLASCDVEQRFFMFVAEQHGRRPEIRCELSKKDMAAAIGATPETFSRMIRRLQRRGLIRWVGRLLKISPEAWVGVDA
jgi:CRP/FNR family transcriptional regulator